MAALSLVRGGQWVRWQAGRLAARPGWALAALALSVLLLLAALAAGWHINQAAQVRRAALAERTALRQLAQPAPQADLAERRAALAAFRQALPPADELPALVQSLMDLAAAQGLTLQRGSYRQDSLAGFSRAHIALPLRGDPAKVQAFVQAALAAWPTLALDSLQLTRQTVDPPVVDGRVQWLFHLRSPVAAPGAAAPAPGEAQ